MNKPIHAKPSLYAYFFYQLKEIALKYGYNLVLHGSLNRDMDLIAIPWQEVIKSHDEMIEEFIEALGGSLMYANGVDRNHARTIPEKIKKDWPKYTVTHHGRMQYVINLKRECEMINNEWVDPQYYIDISVIPASKSNTDSVEPFKIPEEDLNEIVDKMNAFDAVHKMREAQALIDLSKIKINS